MTNSLGGTLLDPLSGICILEMYADTQGSQAEAWKVE